MRLLGCESLPTKQGFERSSPVQAALYVNVTVSRLPKLWLFSTTILSLEKRKFHRNWIIECAIQRIRSGSKRAGYEILIQLKVPL